MYIMGMLFILQFYFVQSFSLDLQDDIQSLKPRSLIYQTDKVHNLPHYCEFVTMDQVKTKNGHFYTEERCSIRNPNMILKRGGKNYYPFFKYTSGEKGILLQCPQPKNVTLVNCLWNNLVYSKCSYNCSGTLHNITCDLKGPLDNVSAEWSREPVCKSEKHDNEDVGGDDGHDDNDYNIYIIVGGLCISFLILFAIVRFCFKSEASRDSTPETGNSTEKLGLMEPAGTGNNDDANRVVNGDCMPPHAVGIGELGPEKVSLANYGHGFLSKKEQDKKVEDFLNVHGFGEPMGSAMTSLRCEGNRDLCGSHRPDETDVSKCTASVSTILTQRGKYLETLCYMTEEIPSAGEKNTFKGLIRDLKLLNPERAIDVHQAHPKAYLDVIRPALAHLTVLSDHGIKMARLIDYFDDEKIVNHLMRIHKDCLCCQNIAGKKYF